MLIVIFVEDNFLRDRIKIMKNFSQIADCEFLLIIKSKVQNERQLTLEVIGLLREVYRRRLHHKRGYSSLHEFCVEELKYSDGAAFRRIKAMRLVEDIPEVAQSLETGKLNLSTASQLQSVFESKAKENSPMTQKEKIELVGLVQNQSRREAERTIAKVCPEVARVPERVRSINQTQVKVELVIEDKLFQKIEKLKALTSQKNKSLIELLEELVDQELRRKDPEQRFIRSRRSLKQNANLIKTEIEDSKTATASPAKTNLNTIEARSSRYIPLRIKNEVWIRDQGQCTYVDPLTKRKCEGKHKLTYEHIQPFSLGGKSITENLRLLCANHNRLTALHVFGRHKMQNYKVT